MNYVVKHPDYFRRAVKSAGVSFLSLGESVGLSSPKMSHILNGRRRLAFHEVESFAEALNMDFDAFANGLFGAPHPFTKKMRESKPVLTAADIANWLKDVPTPSLVEAFTVFLTAVAAHKTKLKNA